MDIDLTVLKSLEAEKDISLDLAIKAIEDALLVLLKHFKPKSDLSPTDRSAIDDFRALAKSVAAIKAKHGRGTPPL